MKADDTITLAMKIKKSGLTREQMEEALEIADGMDYVSNLVLSHFAGYQSGKYHGIELEFVESLIRKLAKDGLINWNKVPKDGRDFNFVRQAVEVRDEEETNWKDTQLFGRIRSIKTNTPFKLDTPSVFPEGGFSLRTANQKRIIRVLREPGGKYRMQLSSKWTGTDLIDTEQLFENVSDLVDFCTTAALKVPKPFRKEATILAESSGNEPYILQELASIVRRDGHMFELDDEEDWPAGGFSVFSAEKRVSITVVPVMDEEETADSGHIEISLKWLNGNTNEEDEPIAGGQLPDMATLIRKFTDLGLPVPRSDDETIQEAELLL
jgi:hypothetical protein